MRQVSELYMPDEAQPTRRASFDLQRRELQRIFAEMSAAAGKGITELPGLADGELERLYRAAAPKATDFNPHLLRQRISEHLS